MTFPKLHHYVPRFYLERFTDAEGRLWTWDKTRDVSFLTSPSSVAAETHFYRQDDLAEAGHDLLTLEKQLADIEGEVSKITGQWIDWLSEIPQGETIQIPQVNREIVSLFLCLQYLRTLDAREILIALANFGRPLSAVEKRYLHTTLLWDEATFRRVTDHFHNSTWIFGRNETPTPFVTSDNPITFRTPDNRQWVRAGVLGKGIYAAYPLSPAFILFCHDREHWKALEKYDCSVSPVVFTEEMVEDENTGQVFMASRFVFSNVNDFEKARDFEEAIKTDRYAPK
jgi:hypothetical protein